MANKYKAQKIRIDDFTFDSKIEGERYLQLKKMQEMGMITGLKLQPQFELIPAFTTKGGKKYRSMGYTADFSYYQNGSWIVEDVKGFITRDASMRIKMLCYLYKDSIHFRIIKRKEINQTRKELENA